MDWRQQITYEQLTYTHRSIQAVQNLENTLKKVRDCKKCGSSFYDISNHVKNCVDCRFPDKEYGLTKHGKLSHRKFSTSK